MELMNSRCVSCTPQRFQCSACLSNDQTAKRAARAAKVAAKVSQVSPIVPLNLDNALPLWTLGSFPNVAAIPLSPPFSFPPSSYPINFAFPPMPSPCPLSVNGDILYPVEPHSPTTPKFASAPLAVKKLSAKKLPAKRPLSPYAAQFQLSDGASDSDSDEESSGGSSATGDDNDNDNTKQVKVNKKKMPRITKEERNSVCTWIQKTRKDGKVPFIFNPFFLCYMYTRC
jgi:hypothetical protein